MKIVEVQKTAKGKIGRVNKSGLNPEPHEESTALHLAQYGFDIDFVKPRNAKESTVKEDFRKAKRQSDRVIFDLRRIKGDAEKIEKYIIKIFSAPGYVRRLIIIEKDRKVIDFSK